MEKFKNGNYDERAKVLSEITSDATSYKIIQTTYGYIEELCITSNVNVIFLYGYHKSSIWTWLVYGLN